MKKVNIQSLSLMMLIAMIYAAPHGQTDEQTDPKILLQDIKKAVEQIIDNKTMWKDIYVPAIPKKHHTICVENFFCCAEKAVNGTGLENLTRLLHQYNNITNKEGNTNCSLNKESTVTLHKVLEEIKGCAKNRKMK